MDAGAAASFYRRKGYTVREGVRATGASGNEHKVPLLAEGPLGSLAVFFGDLGGIDGPEMGGARKVARDLGATPVLAAAQFSNQDRQVAARLGVVLLDDDAVAVEAPAVAAAPPPADPARAWPGLVPIPARSRASSAAEADAHPWPASGRVGGVDGAAARNIDVDELLAPRRRADAVLAAASAPPAPAAALAAPAAHPVPAPSASAPMPEAAAAGDADSFWTLPRREPQATRPPPRQASGRPFTWLEGADAAPASRPAASAAMAAEYDGVVAARASPAAAPDAEPAPEGPSGPPLVRGSYPILTADRVERRARLQRRLVWLLAGAVLVYLFVKWWY